MRVKLGSLYKISSGGTPLKKNKEYYDDGDINWVKTGDLKQQYLFDTQDCITQIGLEKSSAKMYEENTVLVAMYGATIGATSILKIPACTNQACAAFPKIDKVIPEYLYYFLKSKKKQFVKDGVGGAQPNISASYLKNVDFILTEVKEQKKIVETLDKTGRLIELKRQQLQELDTLIKSRFVEMFGDLKHNSKEWSISKFDEFAIIDTKMVKDFEKYAKYPHIGIVSIEKETGKLSGYRTVEQDKVISGKYLFSPNHIIYSKIRPNLNKVALPKFEGVCSADAYPILPRVGVCTREYLGYTMRSDFFLNYILAFSSRTNLPKVNKKQVMGFEMPLPPIDMQNEFSGFIHQVDKLKGEVQNSLDETQILFDSLMQEYFE